MGVEIQDINFAPLPNETVNEFMALIVALMLDDPAVERELGEELQADQLAFQALIHQQKRSGGMTLKEVDKIVDQNWRGTKNQLKLSSSNPNPLVKEAASPIYAAFMTVSDPTAQKYDFQYGALLSLLEKLEAFSEAQLAQAYVLDWVKALRKGVDLFHDLKKAKTQSKSKKKLGAAKEAREKVCATYQRIIKRLNAIMILHPDDLHAELNAKIDQAVTDRKLSDKLGKRKPDEDGDDKEEA